MVSSVTAPSPGAPFTRGRKSAGRLWSALRLGGYVEFNLPRTVTASGVALLLGLVAMHIYVLVTQPVPGYFVRYSGLVIAGCAVAAVAMWAGPNPAVPRAGWFLGSLVAALFLASYVISRPITLAGLAPVTGHWGFAPGTFALACAAGFLGIHLSVLLGINVAYPQRRHWHD